MQEAVSELRHAMVTNENTRFSLRGRLFVLNNTIVQGKCKISSCCQLTCCRHDALLTTTLYELVKDGHRVSYGKTTTISGRAVAIVPTAQCGTTGVSGRPDNWSSQNTTNGARASWIIDRLSHGAR